MHGFVFAVGMNETQGVGVCNERGSKKQHFHNEMHMTVLDKEAKYWMFFG